MIILSYMKDRLGRSYSQEQIRPYLGKEIYGYLGEVFMDKIDLNLISHYVKDLRIVGDDLVGTVVVLDTPTGKILQELLKAEVEMHLSMAATGIINEDKSVSALNIISINMMPGKGEWLQSENQKEFQ